MRLFKPTCLGFVVRCALYVNPLVITWNYKYMLFYLINSLIFSSLVIQSICYYTSNTEGMWKSLLVMCATHMATEIFDFTNYQVMKTRDVEFYVQQEMQGI